MIFPVPIPMPMYIPQSNYNPYPLPSINTRKIESELSGIADGIKDISKKLDTKDISINTDTDALLPVMSLVGAWVVRERDAYDRRYSEISDRIDKIDAWKAARKKKKKERDKQEKDFRAVEAGLWNDALKQDAEFNYKNQPRGKWWKGWVEKPYSEFLAESGYVPVKDGKREKRRQIDMDWQDHLERMADIDDGMFNFRYMSRRIEIMARKPAFYSMFHEIIKLHTICEQIRGASISIPSDLMQAVSVIARDIMANTLEGEK